MNYIHYQWPLRQSEEFVSRMIGCNDLSACSFYKKQEDLSVDAIRDLISWCELAGTRYVIMVHAESMLPEAANALLKTLEENEHVVFVFNTKRPLIDTIQSRCRIMANQTQHDEIMDYINDQYHHYLVIDPGAAERAWDFSHDKDVIDDLFTNNGPMHILKELDSDFEHYVSSPKDLLKLLGFLEEKNSDNYYDKYHQYIQELCGYMIGRFFYTLAYDEDYETRVRAADKMKLISEHSRLAERNTYTKNDFFELLCDLCA